MILALAIAGAVALAAGTTPLVLLAVLVMAATVLGAGRRIPAPMLPLAASVLTYFTYLVRAAGIPFRSGAAHFVREPVVARAAPDFRDEGDRQDGESDTEPRQQPACPRAGPTPADAVAAAPRAPARRAG